MADESLALPFPGGRLKLVDNGDGTYSLGVASSGGGGGASTVDQGAPGADAWPVTGPLTNAQLTAVTGTAAQTAVTTDPSAAGQTVVALLRGILSELQAQTALLNDIKTNTTP